MVSEGYRSYLNTYINVPITVYQACCYSCKSEQPDHYPVLTKAGVCRGLLLLNIYELLAATVVRKSYRILRNTY